MSNVRQVGRAAFLKGVREGQIFLNTLGHSAVDADFCQLVQGATASVLAATYSSIVAESSIEDADRWLAGVMEHLSDMVKSSGFNLRVAIASKKVDVPSKVV